MSLTIFDSPDFGAGRQLHRGPAQRLGGQYRQPRHAGLPCCRFVARNVSIAIERSRRSQPFGASRSVPTRPETGDAFKAVAASAHTLVYHDGTNLDIEQQASELAKNTMEYNLALSLMTSQFHTFEAVISERA